jgi:RNA polymerase sigma factor (sigma-70 family)
MTTISMAGPAFPGLPAIPRLDAVRRALAVAAPRDLAPGDAVASDCVTLAGVAGSQVGSTHPYRSLDNEALGKMIAERDSDALEQLYDRHGSACYGLARRIVADEQLAHDVVQEVFLAIWKGSASYDGSRGSLTTWLFALTHHKSVDAVRRAQRHSGRRAPEEALETEADLSPGVEEQAIDMVRRDKVRAALASLPEPQKEALLLAYFGGYTQSEIAAMTDTPLGTVKTRTLAALRRLRGVLGDAKFPGALGEGEGA